MSWDDAGGAAPLAGHGRLAVQRRGLLGARRALCRCRGPQMSAGNYSSCRAGGRAFPRLESPAGAPQPAPPPPSWGRQPHPSPNPARKSAREEKNTRRKMSRGRKEKKHHNPGSAWFAGGPEPAGAGRPGGEPGGRLCSAARAGGAGGRRGPAGGGSRRGAARRCPRADRQRCPGEPALLGN